MGVISSYLVTCRCSEEAVGFIPEYMKDFYLYLLKTFDSFEDELGQNKGHRVFYLKEMASIVFDSIDLVSYNTLALHESM